MDPLTRSKNATVLPVLIALLLACFGLSPTAQAANPGGDTGYPNQNSAEDEIAPFRLTTGAPEAAIGLDALDGNTTASDNAPLASWTWRPTGSLNTARAYHTATLLSNGMVLVSGGQLRRVSASAELYDPLSRTWTTTGSLNTACASHTATLLPNGMVLVAGGISDLIYSASTELYDPVSGTWTPTGSLKAARSDHTATLLHDRTILVAGGTDTNDRLAVAELGRPQP